MVGEDGPSDTVGGRTRRVKTREVFYPPVTSFLGKQFKNLEKKLLDTGRKGKVNSADSRESSG